MCLSAQTRVTPSPQSRSDGARSLVHFPCGLHDGKMNLDKAGFPLYEDALWVDYGREHDHPKNRSAMGRSWRQRNYLGLKRLAAYRDLARCDPKFETLRLEAASVKGDQDCIGRSSEAKAEVRPHLRFRLPPILEFMPPGGTPTFKDFIGTARDGLIDSPSLFSGVDLAGTDCALLRRRCFCSHEVLRAARS